jgi:hypothetical protein
MFRARHADFSQSLGAVACAQESLGKGYFVWSDTRVGGEVVDGERGKAQAVIKALREGAQTARLQ